MQVIHIAHHVDPLLIAFLEKGLYVSSAVLAGSVVLLLIARCCCRKS